MELEKFVETVNQDMTAVGIIMLIIVIVLVAGNTYLRRNSRTR